MTCRVSSFTGISPKPSQNIWGIGRAYFRISQTMKSNSLGRKGVFHFSRGKAGEEKRLPVLPFSMQSWWFVDFWFKGESLHPTSANNDQLKA